MQDNPTLGESNSFVAAAGNGAVDLVADFIRRYPQSVDLQDQSAGHTAMAWAVINGRQDVVRTLLAGGAGIDARDRFGWTPLMHAAWHNQGELVTLLLEKGSCVDARDDKGQTALMKAASIGRTEVARQLLEGGAQLEAVEEKGRDARSFAREGHPDMIELLEAWPEIARRAATLKEKAEHAAEMARQEAAAQKVEEVNREKLKNQRSKNPFKKGGP